MSVRRRSTGRYARPARRRPPFSGQHRGVRQPVESVATVVHTFRHQCSAACGTAILAAAPEEAAGIIRRRLERTVIWGIPA